MDLIAVPLAPRTPSPRAHKLVFRYQGALWVNLLGGAIFLLVGGILSMVFCWRLPADVCLAFGGNKSVPAQVVNAYVDRTTKINGAHPIRIQFTYDGVGNDHKAEAAEVNTTDPEVIAMYRPGTRADAEVCSLNSSWVRLPGTRVSLLGLWGLLMLLFPAIGIGLLGSAVRKKKRQVRAFVHGQPVEGKLTFKGLDKTVSINGQNPTVVKWSFTIEGKTLTGSLSSMDPGNFESLEKKDVVIVLYDPEDPSSNTIFIE